MRDAAPPAPRPGLAVACRVLRGHVVLPTLETMVGSVRVVVSLHAVAIAAGVAAGLLLALRRARHPDVVLVVAPLAVLAGVAGARAWHAALHAAPGLSSVGGMAGGLAAVLVASRVARADPWDLFDALVPGAVLGFGIGRLGCFLGGCCYGLPTALPWGVVVPELGPPPRHPVQLYAAAADLAVAAFAARGTGPAGRATRRAMVGYGSARLLLEALRDPAATDLLLPSWPSVAQLAAVMLVAVGACLRPRAGERDTRDGRGYR